MNRLLILAGALVALASPAAAQTKTGDYVTRDTRITGDSDGKVTVKSLAKTLTPPVPSGTTLYGPCEGRVDYTYRVRAACEPVAPPPVEEPPIVTPPPVVTPTPDPVPSDVVGKLLPGGTINGTEAAIRNSRISFGFNSDGNLGTINNAGVPAPFTTDKKNGFVRLGGVTETGDDFILQGRAQDFTVVIANGVTYAAGRLGGYRLIQGTFADPFTFAGETQKSLGNGVYQPTGIKVDQRVTLDGTALSYKVRLTNSTASPVSVTYARSTDPDTRADYATQNRVVSQGRWEAGLSTGETYILDTPDLGAYAATATYDKATTIGTRREVGYSAKADLTLQMVWPARVLQPGEFADYSFRQGIK